MVVPLVVLDQLGHGCRLPQQGVDQCGGLILVCVPQPLEPGAQLADRVELGLVVRARPGPPPGRDELVEGGGVGQEFLAAAAGVDQRRGIGQRYLGVMGKKHLESSRAAQG